MADLQAIDVDLVGLIADFIARYRRAEAPPPTMLPAVLAQFPGASESHYALGICLANRLRAAK